MEVAPPPPPHVPTQEEIKEQLKQDHQTLNQLKIRLQPIMDELKKKYKKFFNPVVSLSLIGYLLQENDESYIQPDLSQAERPYELASDATGTKGLRETATGKFFYNLDLSTIEERLANGFYARAQDFLTDIRHMVHDNSQSGDKNVKFKAQQLLANVEIDIDVLERQPQLFDCENVYQRQLQRAKEREEKRSKKAANAAARASPVRSMVQGEGGPSGTQAGEVSAVESNHAPVMTPLSNPASSHPLGNSSLAAYNSRLSNGSSGVDIIMGDANTPFSKQPTNPHVMQGLMQQWPNMKGAPLNISNSATGNRTQVPQIDTLQILSQGQSPSQLYNSASPTTSGRKSSEYQTSRSTQATDGNRKISDHDISGFSQGRWSMDGHAESNDSQLPLTQDPTQEHTSLQSNYLPQDWHLPDTQSQDLVANNTQSSSGGRGQNSSFPPPVPSFNNSQSRPQSRIGTNVSPSPTHPASLNRLMNTPTSSEIQLSQPVSSGFSAPPSQQVIQMQEEAIRQLFDILVDGTKGCTVEMLEQVYRELMVEIWNQRGNNQRVLVGASLMTRFKEVMEDMEEVRGLERGSFGEE